MKLFLLSLCMSTVVVAQTKVNVKSNYALKDFVKISPVLNSAYHTPELVQDSVEVKDNLFSFKISKGEDSFYYPYKFAKPIGSSSFVMSSEIFLNPQNQNLVIDPKFQVSYKNETAGIGKDLKRFQNFVMYWEAAKDAAHADLLKKIDLESDGDKKKVLQNDYFRIDKDFEVEKLKTIKDYVELYPQSVIGFWQLVLNFEYNGYRPIIDDIATLFDASIKKENAYKVFLSRLKSSKVLAIGQTFPQSVKLKDVNGKVTQMIFPKNKYTLVDFWFSHCAPCIEEMPKHIALYNKYREKGYGIVGIAVDLKAAQGNLVKTVNKLGMPWTNYWDENRIQAEKWMVTSYPTTYLLDSQGKIVAKNLSKEDLEKFLIDNL